MIINEYTDQLRDNQIDLLTDLTSLAAPVLSMRNNEYVVPFGGKLVLNYHVCDYYGAEYPELDGTVTVGRKGMNTFTFVARIDEDTLDLDQVPEFRQTTLEGEQVMEIDLEGMAAGPHSVLVQAISNGVSSPVEWLKFRIKDEDEDTVRSVDESFVLAGNVIDLDSVANGFSFSSSYANLGSSQVDADDSNKVVEYPENCSSKYLMYKNCRPGSSASTVSLRTVVANYVVTKNSANEIQIDVSNGSIIDTDINQWTGYLRYLQKEERTYDFCGYGNAVRDKEHRWENISNPFGQVKTYKLTKSVTVGGATYDLTDYLESAPADIPSAVRVAAIKNKIALTRLCEAVQAFFYGNTKTAGKCGLKLPQGMSIVFDYHGFEKINETGTNSYNYNEDAVSSDEQLRGLSNTHFPNRFTLDLNGSTVASLQVNDIKNGMFLAITDCYDTHIVNGKIQGGFKYRKYADIPNTPYIKDKGDLRLAESLSNIRIVGSEFCTFENIEDYWSVGYDAECSGRNNLISGRNDDAVHKSVWRIPFNQPGWIDENGKIHVIESSDAVDCIPRFTMGLEDVGVIGSNNYATKSYVAFNSLLHKIIKVDDQYLYRGRKSFNDNTIYLRGAHNLIIHNGDTVSGDDAFAQAAGMYIYFYKEFDPDSEVCQAWLADMAAHEGEEGYLPDFEPLEFIKAYKIMPSKPFLVPKGAVYAHLCATGPYMVDKWVGLRRKMSNEYFARNVFWQYQSSWCSGFKDCFIHDHRTSILNFHYAYQCFVADTFTCDLGSGRHQNQGGMSNQPYHIDTEDNSAFAGNTTISNTECISGSNGSRFHHPINLILDHVRNLSITLEKNVFVGVLKNSYASVTNKLGYSHPIKFMRFFNNIFNKVSTSFDGRGSNRGIMLIENCTYRNSSTAGTSKIVDKRNNETDIITQEIQT